LSPAQSLAREYAETDLSPEFRANGTVDPDDDDYQEQSAKGFADWSLDLGGLIERPAKFSLADLRAMPSRTQITRHDCVEGWSCIGKWKGVPVSEVIERVGLKPAARYLMFYCADPMNVGDPESKYYESIGMDEALHPQTILAYDMNDKALDIPHGAVAAACRTSTRLQDGEIHHEDRGGREFRVVSWGQGRLLGRPWLCLVRGNLALVV
jgi:hypothetical protein